MFWLKKSRISMLLLCLFFMTQTVSALDVKWENTQLELSTDKACYAPGNTVTFTAVGNLPSGKEVYVRYRHNNTFIEKHTITSKTWTWTPPQPTIWAIWLTCTIWNGTGLSAQSIS